MKKSDWQYLVDSLLFICILGIAVIGFLMGLVIPKGPAAPEKAKYFLGLHRHQWGNIHFYLSIAFVILVIIHLIFSWKWIKAKALQLFKRKWAMVLILTVIISILVLFFSWLFYPKVPGAYSGYGIRAGRKAKEIANEKIILKKEIKQEEEGQKIKEKANYEEIQTREEEEKLAKGRRASYQTGILITGQMTLYYIERVSGIPARKIADKLGLPAHAPLNERLGWLRKQYSFTMQEARDVVASLMKENERR